MLNYRSSARSELGIPLKRLLAGVEKAYCGQRGMIKKITTNNLPKPYSHSIIIRMSTLNLRHHQPLIMLA